MAPASLSMGYRSKSAWSTRHSRRGSTTCSARPIDNHRTGTGTPPPALGGTLGTVARHRSSSMAHIHPQDPPGFECPCDDGLDPEDLATYTAVADAGRMKDGCSTTKATRIFDAYREAMYAD